MAATTEQDETTGAPPARPRGRRIRRRIAAVVGFIGEVLITLGLVLGLFVVYTLWWTNVLADREAARASDRVRDQWAQGPGELDTGRGIGFLHVPAMDESAMLVTKGTKAKNLDSGVAGYYTKPVKADMPWKKKGNFSLAAHRDGHGAKFHNIHKMREGDPIVFETRDTWYVYRVFAQLPQTSKYNTGVLEDVPKGSGKKKPGRYLTLTTCTPIYTSDYRYIVWAELERTEKVDGKRTPPKELNG